MTLPTELSQKEMEAEVEKIKYWHHCIDLGKGIHTKKGKEKKRTLRGQKNILRAFPKSFEGKTVLDIGAWDGFYSFEAERRGASRVLATDSFIWENQELYGLTETDWQNFGAGKRGFELARRILKSQVEDKNIDVMELSPEKIGTWDVVLFLNVLYHMQHPLLALEKVASVTKEQLILITYVDPLLSFFDKPLMKFYPNKELSNDPTNWFGPNPSMVKAMLETVGFKKNKLLRRSWNRALFWSWRED